MSDIILAGHFFMRCHQAELVAIKWREAGANWRRVKRERRKAFERGI